MRGGSKKHKRGQSGQSVSEWRPPEYKALNGEVPRLMSIKAERLQCVNSI